MLGVACGLGVLRQLVFNPIASQRSSRPARVPSPRQPVEEGNAVCRFGRGTETLRAAHQCIWNSEFCIRDSKFVVKVARHGRAIAVYAVDDIWELVKWNLPCRASLCDLAVGSLVLLSRVPRTAKVPQLRSLHRERFVAYDVQDFAEYSCHDDRD